MKRSSIYTTRSASSDPMRLFHDKYVSDDATKIPKITQLLTSPQDKERNFATSEGIIEAPYGGVFKGGSIRIYSAKNSPLLLPRSKIIAWHAADQAVAVVETHCVFHHDFAISACAALQGPNGAEFAASAEGQIKITRRNSVIWSYLSDRPMASVAMAQDASLFAAAFAQTGVLVVHLEDGTPRLKQRCVQNSSSRQRSRASLEAPPGSRVGIDARRGRELRWNLDVPVSEASRLSLANNRKAVAITEPRWGAYLMQTDKLEVKPPGSKTLQPIMSSMKSLSWSPDDQLLAVTDGHKTANIFGPAATKPIFRYLSPYPIKQLTWLRDANGESARPRLCVLSDAGILVMSVKKPLFQHWVNNTAGTNLMAASPSGLYLAAAGGTNMAIFADDEREIRAEELPASISALHWSTFGLAIGCTDGSMFIKARAAR